MNRLRYWFLAFFAWSFGMYNVERLHAPLNLASFIYVLAAVAALLIVVRPALSRAAPAALLMGVLPLVLAFKVYLGYEVGGEHLPITVTELFAVGVTILLAQRVGRSFEELRESLLLTIVGDRQDRSQAFSNGQAELYREVRRARLYGRPLALLAMRVQSDGKRLGTDRIAREFRRDTRQAYLRARLAALLGGELKDSDLLTVRGDHFVALLPETDAATAGDQARRLAAAAREHLDLRLDVGLSAFPDEEVTFVKLLERAEERMHGPAPTRPARAPRLIRLRSRKRATRPANAR